MFRIAGSLLSRRSPDFHLGRRLAQDLDDSETNSDPDDTNVDPLVNNEDPEDTAAVDIPPDAGELAPGPGPGQAPGEEVEEVEMATDGVAEGVDSAESDRVETEETSSAVERKSGEEDYDSDSDDSDDCEPLDMPKVDQCWYVSVKKDCVAEDADGKFPYMKYYYCR